MMSNRHDAFYERGLRRRVIVAETAICATRARRPSRRTALVGGCPKARDGREAEISRRPIELIGLAVFFGGVTLERLFHDLFHCRSRRRARCRFDDDLEILHGMSTRVFQYALIVLLFNTAENTRGRPLFNGHTGKRRRKASTSTPQVRFSLAERFAEGVARWHWLCFSRPLPMRRHHLRLRRQVCGLHVEAISRLPADDIGREADFASGAYADGGFRAIFGLRPRASESTRMD